MRKAAEAVTQGHPDKVCDQIADAIVDEYLRRDPAARVNVGVLGSRGMIVVGGEVRSRADFDVAALVKQAYADTGYADEAEVFVNVNVADEPLRGARVPADAAVVNGYATKETREMLPRAFVFANNMARRLNDLRPAILERVVSPMVGEDGVQLHVNPNGAFVHAGFAASSGMSGNKLASDTYGGLIPHGDASISGR